jgi:hypothetical protein
MSLSFPRVPRKILLAVGLSLQIQSCVAADTASTEANEAAPKCSDPSQPCADGSGYGGDVNNVNTDKAYTTPHPRKLVSSKGSMKVFEIPNFLTDAECEHVI